MHSDEQLLKQQRAHPPMAVVSDVLDPPPPPLQPPTPLAHVPAAPAGHAAPSQQPTTEAALIAKALETEEALETQHRLEAHKQDLLISNPTVALPTRAGAALSKVGHEVAAAYHQVAKDMEKSKLEQKTTEFQGKLEQSTGSPNIAPLPATSTSFPGTAFPSEKS
jgi:hypothetical protein